MTSLNVETPTKPMPNRVAMKPGQSLFMDMWYVAGRLDEIRAGSVRVFRICGRDLAIQRDRNGACVAEMVDGGLSVPCQVKIQYSYIVHMFIYASLYERYQGRGREVPCSVLGAVLRFHAHRRRLWDLALVVVVFSS